MQAIRHELKQAIRSIVGQPVVLSAGCEEGSDSSSGSGFSSPGEWASLGRIAFPVDQKSASRLKPPPATETRNLRLCVGSSFNRDALPTGRQKASGLKSLPRQPVAISPQPLHTTRGRGFSRDARLTVRRDAWRLKSLAPVSFEQGICRAR